MIEMYRGTVDAIAVDPCEAPLLVRAFFTTIVPPPVVGGSFEVAMFKGGAPELYQIDSTGLARFLGYIDPNNPKGRVERKALVELENARMMANLRFMARYRKVRPRCGR